MFIEIFYCFQHFSSIIFYPGGEIVTISKIPKFSNKTPVAKKLDHFCDVQPLFMQSGLIFWLQEFRY